MAEEYVTGDEGYALIRERALDARYVKHGEYPTHEKGLPPVGRRARTHEALRDGPRVGHDLFRDGNWMPRNREPMSEAAFSQHLKWMVRNSYLHVVSPCR